MNAKPLFDAATDAALRDLDPAPAHAEEQLSTDERAVASSTVRRILGSDPASSSKATGAKRRRRNKGWLVAAAVAAASVVALVIGVVLPNGQAYADWSPVPTALTAAQVDTAMATCLEDVDLPSKPSPSQARLLLAERRGGWTYVLFMPSSDSEASCLFPDEQAPDDPYRWGKFDSGISPEPAPRPNEVQEWGYTTGTTKEGLFSWNEGVVGRDVTAVTITTPVGQRVTASVGNGRYAAWWPAGENYQENPQLGGGLRIEATLRDGTTKIFGSR